MPADAASEPAPIFLLRDFSIGGVKITLDLLKRKHPQVMIPGVAGSPKQGQIFRTVVRDQLHRAAAAVALVDEPNANVGFELGFALGLGKRVALACARADVPAWLNRPPLNGFLVATKCGLSALGELVTGDDWIEPPGEPHNGEGVLFLCPTAGEGVLFLCPTAGEGEALHTVVEEDKPHWQRLPASGWSLDDLPERLAGIGTIVWVLAPYPSGTDTRDGAENAAAAVVAGYAQAHGRTVRILRHPEFRQVLDVVQWEEPFADLDAFVRLLAECDATAAKPTAGDPIAAYRAYLRHAHRHVVPFFPHASRAYLDQIYVEITLERALVDGGIERAAGERAKTTVFDRARRDAWTLRDLLALPRTGTDEPADVTGRWVVKGDPGGGKTTAARHLAWELADPDAPPETPVPVYVPLPRYAGTGKHPFSQAELDVAAGQECDATGLEQALRDRAATPGAVWLLLDGLDEIAPDKQETVREWLNGLLASLPDVVVCVMTRPIGYRALGPAFREASLRPLAGRAQRELLCRWLGDTDGEATWSRLQERPALAELAGNPLMLTLVAGLSLEQPELPPTRMRLYDRSIELLLRRGFGLEPKGVVDPPSARHVLAALALDLQTADGEAWPLDELENRLFELERDDATLAARRAAWPSREAFLHDVADHSGLLGPHDGPREPWRFLHRQLREFLAAVELERQETRWLEIVSKIAADEDLLPRWTECLGLLCARADDPMMRLSLVRKGSAATARRVLPEVEGVDPAETLAFLLDDEEWEADDLRRLAASWRASGLGPADVTELLMPEVERFRDDLDRLGMLHWVMSSVGVEPERGEFFGACGRSLDGVPALDWVSIPAGEFVMGSPSGEVDREGDEGPQHEVRVPEFELARTTVTHAQYAAFDPDHMLYYWEDVERNELPSHPVVNVSWWCASLYCAWARCRLPSEAEWEYACRAGTTEPFALGSNVTPDDANYDGNHPYADGARGEYRGRSVRAGALPSNVWGLHEMHGNVREWCADPWHDSYDGAPSDGSVWGDGGAASSFVVRGGSWFSVAGDCRSAFRGRGRAGNRFGDLGFRPARSSPDSATTSRRDPT